MTSCPFLFERSIRNFVISEKLLFIIGDYLMSDFNSGDLGLENLKMRQTWIQEKTQQTKDLYNYDDSSEAFQDLVLSLIFDISIDDIDNEEIVDAPQDKQIDIIHIEKDEDTQCAHVHILQVNVEE